MIRYLIALFACLCLSTTAFASGKFVYRPGKNIETGERESIFGLSIYQKLYILPVSYVGWAGAGLYGDKTSNWYKVDQRVETYIQWLTVGAGIKYQYNPYLDNTTSKIMYGSFSISLW